MKCGGFSIPVNSFGPGLSIAHGGTIVVNNTARIGKNCRIHEGVTIGATGKNGQAEAVLKKLLASGMSADEILEKLK